MNRIAMRWMPAAELADSAWLREERALGIASFGVVSMTGSAHLPHAQLRTPVINGEAACELWLGRQAARSEVLGATHCRHNGELLFATVSVEPKSAADDALGDATYLAYRSLLDALHATGYPHLLRIWNSIPDINIDDAGLERYRRFNLQRFRAYEESQRPTHTGAPAACALGSAGGPLVLYCLASKTPAEAIENPRQVSAYKYPQQYGPRAPNFSRAALWRSDKSVLFVSGTASIVGHETLHIGDIAAQARETLMNLESVLAEAARVAQQPLATLSQMLLKAYIRNADDVAVARSEIARHGLDADRVLYLHADICRAELLMEIEAIGPAQTITTGTADTPDSASRPNSDSRALQETG
ncbi:MAG: endoribonuclease L-PSP [Burkholderiaceae bacterium]